MTSSITRILRTLWERARIRLNASFRVFLKLTSPAFWKIFDATLGRYVFIKLTRYSTVEVASMKFVRQRTTIPVPRVYAVIPSWSIDGYKYIVMERMRGRAIYTSRFWESLPDSHRDAIISQLRDFVSQIRAIAPPPQSYPFICNVLGGPVMDHRLSVEGPYGPYRDEEQMNLQIRLGKNVEGILRWQSRPLDPELVDGIKAAHALRHPIVFTHNDIAPRNIMIEGGRVTGLIDWECAGWFPAHWEYVKAMWSEYSPNRTFANDIAKFIPPFETESQADLNIGWSRDWRPALDL